MRTILLILFIIFYSISYAQSEGDSLNPFEPVGVYFEDTLALEIDYEEIVWEFSDTMKVNLNQLTGHNKFKSGSEYNTIITINNSSLKPLKIKSISSPCSCLVTQVSGVLVNPGGDFELELKYKAMEPGDYEDIITLYGYDGSLTRPLALMNVKLVYSVELNDNN